jgi:hypothetical protein
LKDKLSVDLFIKKSILGVGLFASQKLYGGAEPVDVSALPTDKLVSDELALGNAVSMTLELEKKKKKKKKN